MSVIGNLKQREEQLENEVYTLYLAYKDPRVPWYARAFMAASIGYAISPIDLIPDFIPVLGYLDDLIIIPAGIFLARKMIPREVWEDCKTKAKTEPISTRTKWVMATIVIAVWLLIAYLIVRVVRLAGS